MSAVHLSSEASTDSGHKRRGQKHGEEDEIQATKQTNKQTKKQTNIQTNEQWSQKKRPETWGATINSIAKKKQTNRLAINCTSKQTHTKIYKKKNKTVVTKEEARNMERRMSRLVGNNQQHCKDKQTNRIAINYTAKNLTKKNK